MKSNFLNIFLLQLIFIFSACDSPNGPGEPAGPGFFPMQIGNRWTYILAQDSSFKSTVEIVGKMTIGAHEYFIFERSFSTSSYKDSLFYRQEDGNKVFTYWMGKDELYIDFDMPVDKPWNSFGDYNAVIISKDAELPLPAGTFSNVVKISFDIPNVIDEEHTNSYARHVGLIQTVGMIGPMNLSSAVINGVHIP